MYLRWVCTCPGRSLATRSFRPGLRRCARCDASSFERDGKGQARCFRLSGDARRRGMERTRKGSERGVGQLGCSPSLIPPALPRLLCELPVCLLPWWVILTSFLYWACLWCVPDLCDPTSRCLSFEPPISARPSTRGGVPTRGPPRLVPSRRTIISVSPSAFPCRRAELRMDEVEMPSSRVPVRRDVECRPARDPSRAVEQLHQRECRPRRRTQLSTKSRLTVPVRLGAMSEGPMELGRRWMWRAGVAKRSELTAAPPFLPSVFAFVSARRPWPGRRCDSIGQQV